MTFRALSQLLSWVQLSQLRILSLVPSFTRFLNQTVSHLSQELDSPKWPTGPKCRNLVWIARKYPSIIYIANYVFGLVFRKLCKITLRHKFKIPSQPPITNYSPERTYSTKYLAKNKKKTHSYCSNSLSFPS